MARINQTIDCAFMGSILTDKGRIVWGALMVGLSLLLAWVMGAAIRELANMTGEGLISLMTWITEEFAQ